MLINGVGVVYAGIPFFVMLVLAYLSLGGIVNLDMIVSKYGVVLAGVLLELAAAVSLRLAWAL